MGKYGMQEENENGERLKQFLHINELYITNTAFKHKKKHRETWQCEVKRKKHPKLECHTCGTILQTKGELKRHIKAVHDKIKIIECRWCRDKYDDKGLLQKHIKDVHDKNKPFECRNCRNTFTKRSKLKRHIKNVHHKIEDIKCKKCEYTTTQSSNLEKHIKEKHKKSDKNCSRTN